MKQPAKVNIRPGVSILSILKHIEYDPWFALAEFVDNAIESYLKNEAAIKQIDGINFKLKVVIELNDVDKKILIKDNAAGIQQESYNRAFRAAEVPPDNSGLSEFGMGMKSAACWFSDYWTVRTKALGEDDEKTVVFDLNKIFYDRLEELDVTSTTFNKNLHYTIIELCNIDKMPVKKTKGKIKDHLASIYRQFIRDGILSLFVDNDELQYEDPAILIAPYPYNSSNTPINWRKEIDFEIEKGKMSVKGFVALRETMSNTESGFALFRRGRVIEGSADEGFRPKEIMGDSGSPEYKRIFGELHLEGFNVSFTKKGIKWDENMEIFLELLKSDLSQSSFPLLKQAREYRVKASKVEIRNAAESVVRSTVNDIKKHITPAIQQIRIDSSQGFDKTELTSTKETSFREFEVELNDTKWLVKIELSYDPIISDWIEVGSHLLKEKNENKTTRQVGVRMALCHPFVTHFAGTDKSKLEPILRIAAALGLAEEAAREAGIGKAGTIRMNLNRLLTAISNYNESI